MTAMIVLEVGGWSYLRDLFGSAGSPPTGPTEMTWTLWGSSQGARSTSTQTLTIRDTKSASSLIQTMKGELKYVDNHDINDPHEYRWIVLGENAGYKHMDEDVEAVQCYCGNNQGQGLG